MNTIWNQWYYQNRFLGKPYPFIDNIPRPMIEENNEKVNDSRNGLKLLKEVKHADIPI